MFEKFRGLLSHQASPINTAEQVDFPGTAFLDDYFDKFFLEDNMVFLPDGGICAGIHIKKAIPKETYSKDDFENFNSFLANTYKSLPPGTTVHHQKIVANKENEVVTKRNGGYFTGKMQKHLSDKPVLFVDIFIYLTFNFEFTKQKVSPSVYFSIFSSASRKSGLKDPFSNIQQRKIKVREIFNAFYRQLSSLKGIELEALLHDDWKDQIYEYFSLRFGQGVDSFECNYTIEGNHVKAGHNKVVFVNLYEPGPELHTSIPNRRGLHGFMTEGLGTNLNFPHVVNETILICDKDKELTAMDRKKLIIGSLQNNASQTNIIAFNRLVKFTEESRKDDIPLVRVTHNVMVWHSDSEVLENRINDIRSAYNTMNNSLAVTEELNAGSQFFSYAPGFASNMVDGLLMTANQALTLVDLSEETVTDSQGIIFCNRAHQPVHVDMRHPSLDNRNGVIIGPSGSGKSFFGNVWITQQHEMGYDQVIVDVGGSYKSVVEALDGKYYELTPDTPMRMNIFGVPQDKNGDYFIDSDKSIYLRSLINVLWKDTTKGEDLDRNEDSVFTELLDLYVVHLNKTKAKVSNLISFVKFVSEFIVSKDLSDRWKRYLTMVKMDSFLLNMNKFTSGVYKDIVNSETNVDLSANRLICFDMQGIQKDPVIYPVMALVLVEQVFDKMKRDAVMPKALFMDEAWSFLGGSPVLAKFAENLARTVRKFNGSLIIITQGYSEIKNSRIGDAIRQNMAIKVILDHATQTAIVGDMSDWFGFTPLEQDLIRSIRKADTWREVFIKRQDMASVYVIDAGIHSAVAFSSKAEDRHAIQKAIAKYRRVDFAIDAVVETKLSA